MIFIKCEHLMQHWHRQYIVLSVLCICGLNRKLILSVIHYCVHSIYKMQHVVSHVYEVQEVAT